MHRFAFAGRSGSLTGISWSCSRSVAEELRSRGILWILRVPVSATSRMCQEGRLTHRCPLEVCTALLGSDGRATSCGYNGFGECSIPYLSDGVTYSQVSARDAHTALLRSEGRAVSCGSNGCGECKIPSSRTLAGREPVCLELARARKAAMFVPAAIYLLLAVQVKTCSQDTPTGRFDA